jgi:hypothetical protein
MDPLVQLAAAAIESFVLTGRGGVPDSVRDAVPGKSAGAFVSIVLFDNLESGLRESV